MTKIVSLVVVVCILSSCWPTSKIVKLNKEKAPDLEEVLNKVQLQYKMVLDSLKEDSIKGQTINLEITEAELTLKVTKEFSSSGEVKVLIFKPSGSYTNTRSTEVTYTLSQKENTSGAGSDSTKKEDFTLRDVILSSARRLNAMNVSLGKLTEKSFSVDLVFTIDVEGTAGLTFDVGAFSIDAGATKKHSAEHELKLTFKLKEKEKPKG